MNAFAATLARLGLTLATLCAAASLHAAPYPEHTVHLVVAAPAGGAMDTAARILAEKLTAAWGTPVVVENKPGASGRVAAAAVARSAPDGYTFAVLTNSSFIDELLNPDDQSVSPSRDLAPVTPVFTTPVVLVASNTIGVDTLAQYIALAKSKPGTISVGSSGKGTSTHFFTELLAHQSGIDLIHIPYAGEAPNLNNLFGGHVSSSFLSAMGARKAEASGKVRLLAITTSKRSPLLPQVPSFAELGVAGIDADSWAGVFAPAGTPPALIDRFAAEARQALSGADARAKLVASGSEAMPGTPQDLARRIQSDKGYWTNAIKVTGISLK